MNRWTSRVAAITHVATDVDFPVGVPINQTGAFDQFVATFSVTYGDDALSSLDILDALGTYDFTGLTVFHWTVDDGPSEPLGIIFDELMILESGLFCRRFRVGQRHSLVVRDAVTSQLTPHTVPARRQPQIGFRATNRHPIDTCDEDAGTASTRSIGGRTQPERRP